MSAGERGAAAVLTLAVAVVALTMALLVADVGLFLVARARAQAAADAAALAAAPVTFRPFGAAAGPGEEAAALAAANGAALEECRCSVDTSWRPRTVAVLVSIPVDPILLPATAARAWSTAEFAPTQLMR